MLNSLVLHTRCIMQMCTDSPSSCLAVTICKPLCTSNGPRKTSCSAFANRNLTLSGLSWHDKDLGRELMLCFAVGGVQEDTIRPHKALQVLVAHEMLAKAHVAAVYVLPAIRQLEQKLYSSCSVFSQI